MATKHEIKCVNKNPRNDPHKRIENVGGINGDGTRWKLSEDEAIAAIEAGKYEFYVHQSGQMVEVVIAISRFGNKYLKTQSDGEQPNNLLSLPECP
jgi:hypothetical protein